MAYTIRSGLTPLSRLIENGKCCRASTFECLNMGVPLSDMKNRISQIFSNLTFGSAFVIIFIIAYLPLFSHLDDAPIQVWDELRNAQNALEMNQSGDLIRTTFDSMPETWNTKPPLLIWIQALFLRTLGYNELAVRLPSAIAGFFTCLIIAAYCRRRLGTWLPGILSALVLITIPAYVSTHGTRTGDYDALLVLFTTASVCSVARYVDFGDKRWIYVSALTLTLAVLTKGIAGLFVCPAILLYVLCQRKALDLFQSKQFYIGAGSFLFIVGSYYFLRETQQPGYWHSVMENEIMGRYGKAIETHSAPYWMYLYHLKNWAMVPWFFLIIPSLISGWFARDADQKKVLMLSGIAALSLLLIVSMGQTKLIWYVSAAYPFFAIMCGVFLYQCATLLGRIKITEEIWRVNILPGLLLIAVFWVPYGDIIQQSRNGLTFQGEAKLLDAALYFKKVVDHRQNLDGNVLCGDAYSLKWYKSIIEKRGQELVEIKKENLQAGQRVYVWEDEIRNFVRDHYQVEEMDSKGNLTLYRVLAVK